MAKIRRPISITDIDIEVAPKYDGKKGVWKSMRKCFPCTKKLDRNVYYNTDGKKHWCPYCNKEK